MLVEHNFLTEELQERYEFEKALPNRGIEADVAVARDRNTRERVVVKLYRANSKRQPKPEILEMLKGADAAYVIRQLHYGRSAQRTYQVMEFAEAGSLRDLLNTFPLFSAQELNEIIRQVWAALTYLQGLRPSVVHRDVTPTNILVRSRSPLELVLTDFTLASKLSHGTWIRTDRSRTVHYSAPEAAAGQISAKADWWSLGMIVAEVAGRRHPFGDVPKQALKILLNERKPVPLDSVMEPSVRLLCQGLLCYDPDKRWGGHEVRSWLEHDPILKAPTDAASVRSESGLRARRPYNIGMHDCWTTKELATGLVANWSEAVERIGRRAELEGWLRDDLGDKNSHDLFRNLNESEAFQGLDAAAKLSLWLPMLNPSLPPMVNGCELTQEEQLLKLARDGLTEPSRWPAVLGQGLGEHLAELTGAQWLKEVYRRWAAAAGDARGLDKKLQRSSGKLALLDARDQLTLLVLLLDPDERARAQERLRNDDEVQACPWIDSFPRIGQLGAAGLWLLERRLQEIRGAGRVARAEHARRRLRWTAIGLAIAGIIMMIVYVNHHHGVRVRPLQQIEGWFRSQLTSLRESSVPVGYPRLAKNANNKIVKLGAKPPWLKDFAIFPRGAKNS